MTILDTPGTPWTAYAACAGDDNIDDWHAPKPYGPRRDSPAMARVRAVCARCPVTDDCLAYALEQGISEGIWGGLDPHERRKLT